VAGLPQPPGRPDHTVVSLKPSTSPPWPQRCFGLNRFRSEAAEHPRCRSRLELCRQPDRLCRPLLLLGGGDHQYSIQAHGTLDRRVRAGLIKYVPDVGLPKSVSPFPRRQLPWRTTAHAYPVREAYPPPSAEHWCVAAMGHVSGWALAWLGLAWRSPSSRDRRQLANNYQRSGQAIRAKREIIREVDRQG